MKKVNKTILIIIAAVIVGLILILNCLTQVPTGHTGVVTTFGRVENVTLDAGIHAKLPWQSVVKMDNRIQKGTQTLSCFSADIQEVIIIYTINYQISKTNAMTIYSTIGTSYYDTIILPGINESVKVCTAQYTAEELVSNRSELAAAIQEELKERMEPYNIVIVESAIENMDFTDAFTQAVEAKQVAQQNKLRAETEAQQKIVEAQAAADVRKIEADAAAYKVRVQAEAEAEANELLAKSLTPEILSKMYYDSWNGVLPTVITDGNTLLSIPTITE
ncbi:MAG: prohibitin family protein [Lachnospiraceae bacterium]|nr:prohibitin family protein [Lachnospiraceae bacterium]MBP5253902.1 prohibitin family protein [Lachnospiraceae bacterium]